LYPAKIQEYVIGLFERRNDGVFVQKATIEECEWTPELNECHNNVDFWCKAHPEYKPVRGWLFFALGYEDEHVLFLLHSVMLTPENSFVDITPTRAVDSYPFIVADESDDEFFAKDKYLNKGNLVHVYK